MNNKLEQYWKKVGGSNLSDEFKDLILKMFSYDGSKRPTITELKEHPWIKKPFSVKLTRSFIMDKLNEKRMEKNTNASSRDEDKNYRGGDMKELVRQASESELQLYKFNDMIDHDIEVMPGQVWEELNVFNEDLFEGKLNLNFNQDKKYITIEMQDADTGCQDFLIKAKFYALNNQIEDNSSETYTPRLRLRLVKKRGDI